MACAKRVSSKSFPSLVLSTAIVDLSVKQAVEEWLSYQASGWNIMPFLDLRLSFNSGISFGLFPASEPWTVAALVFASIAMTGAVVWLGLGAKSEVERAGCALIAGGALGNVVDRAIDGLVTDFIDLRIFRWHWPTFNLADVAITCGVVLLLASAGGILGGRTRTSLSDTSDA